MLVAVGIFGAGGDAYMLSNKEPVKKPIPVVEPTDSVDTPQSVPTTQTTPSTTPTTVPASNKRINLDPHAYDVPSSAGGTFTTPTVHVQDYYTPWSYTPSPPTVTSPPSDNCHTMLNC